MKWLLKLLGMKPKTQTFEEWFDAQGFRHFTGKEISRYFSRVHTKTGTRNNPPPRELWENFLPVMRLVDDLRNALQVSVTVLSSYRSKEYNKAVGGKEFSYHMNFIAADITAKGIPAAEVHRILERWREQGRFKGGLGLYTSQNFVHVDTRGHNASW